MKPKGPIRSSSVMQAVLALPYLILRLIINLVSVGLVAWGTLAIFWSNLPWPTARLVLAIVFAIFGVWTLWFSRNLRRRRIFAMVFLAVALWWVLIPPSNYRNWRPEVAVLPRAIVNGDHIKITGVRDFQFKSRHEFTEHRITREVLLSDLVGIDFYLSFWAEGVVGHTFLSFIFANSAPLSISIETRPEVGESFKPIASMFKQLELAYLVGSEEDLVGHRVVHRDEEIFLYRLQVSPQSAQDLFLVYLERINHLADNPEWYHLLINNCTINIIRYANAVGRPGGFNIRHLLNGLITSYLYAAGFLDTSLPYLELRARSRITEAVREAYGQPNFSERIRQGLPGFPESVGFNSLPLE